jgi:ATP-binding cassette subfamily G (WHITE) protein 2 (PDR)
MVCVLGPPGSGCSTLLKTIAEDTHGLHLSEESKFDYNGIPPETLRSIFRGEAIYTAEVDVHYPMLSVETTLYFAALARMPYSLLTGISREQHAAHMGDVVMSQLGISHIRATEVGDDFVRGVSGGGRKRVTIAEATLSGVPLQCWDNSTRGLDSANAIEFCVQ